MTRSQRQCVSEAQIQRALEKIGRDRETVARDRGKGEAIPIPEKAQMIAQIMEWANSREEGNPLTFEEFVETMSQEWLRKYLPMMDWVAKLTRTRRG